MSNYEIALEVLDGKWGNGDERKERLLAAGYDCYAVQSIVNQLCAGTYSPDVSEPDPEPVADTVPAETLEVNFDLSKYNSIKVNFINGGVSE